MPCGKLLDQQAWTLVGTNGPRTVCTWQARGHQCCACNVRSRLGALGGDQGTRAMRDMAMRRRKVRAVPCEVALCGARPDRPRVGCGRLCLRAEMWMIIRSRVIAE